MLPFQAYTLAVLQGASELFPVSSLGHAVIVPRLLGWALDQMASSFLPFLVVLHVGTAAALLAYFWRDWLSLLLGLLGFGVPEERALHRRLVVLIIIATIPAVIAGFILEKPLRILFGTPAVAALFLIVNGLILLGGERLRRNIAEHDKGGGLDQLKWRDAFIIGLWQCLALIPGISRSGATMVGGLLRGLHHEASAHFSFLIATPIILGAAALEIPKMLQQQAALVAFTSVWGLMRYFRIRDFQALNPFAYYCFGLGLSALCFLGFIGA
jgi:undecaprenyl-diphosphatase